MLGGLDSNPPDVLALHWVWNPDECRSDRRSERLHESHLVRNLPRYLSVEHASKRGAPRRAELDLRRFAELSLAQSRSGKAVRRPRGILGSPRMARNAGEIRHPRMGTGSAAHSQARPAERRPVPKSLGHRPAWNQANGIAAFRSHRRPRYSC